MVGPEAIQALCEGIIKRFSPEKVVLFGSYAYGQPDEGSDVDLLVIMHFKGKAPFRSTSWCGIRKPSSTGCAWVIPF